MSDRIEAMLREGRGSFTCPSCGSRADDSVAEYPYCPSGCTTEQMLASPPTCVEAERSPYQHNSRQCLACQRRERWVYTKARELEDAGVHRVLPEAVSLADLLAEDDEETPYLVDGLWPVDGHVVFSGAAKAGKTTVRNNLIRSLVDGVPFLGMFDVATPVSRVVVLDLELTRNSLRGWLRRQQIENVSRVDLHSMRGQAHTLNVLDTGWCSLWEQRLRGADVVILDCLEPMLHALRLDPNTEGRKFLEEWGAMLTRAGVAASLVLHHHGHGAERAKGDSGILGWPDALWDLTVSEDKARYFGALGRDVEVPQARLELTDETGHLTYVGGTSKDADQGHRQALDAEARLLHALYADHARRVAAGEQPPTATTSVQWASASEVEAVGQRAGLGKDRTRGATRRLASSGLLIVSTGKGSSGAKVHALSAEGLARGEAASAGVARARP